MLQCFTGNHLSHGHQSPLRLSSQITQIELTSIIVCTYWMTSVASPSLPEQWEVCCHLPGCSRNTDSDHLSYLAGLGSESQLWRNQWVEWSQMFAIRQARSHSVHPNVQVRALLEANSAITVEENKAVRRSRSPDRRGGWERMESG